MIADAQTTLAPAAIWVMCIVMSILAGFMVSATLFADAHQARTARRYRLAHGIGPVAGEAWADEPVAGGQAPEIPAQAAHEPRMTPEPGAGQAPTRADLPAQRAGDADRAARSYAGPDAPDGEGPEPRPADPPRPRP